MNYPNDLLKKVVQKLSENKIPHMICGSLASSFHGTPRFTNDIDIVIYPSPSQLDKFIDSLGSDFYVSRQAVEDAMKNNQMFNIIDIASSGKIDLILRKNRPFSIEEFSRRKEYFLDNTAYCVVSPEDSILSKLEWSKKTGSEMQFNDALNVSIVQGEKLDTGYLKKWAKELGIDDQLEKLFKEAEKL